VRTGPFFLDRFATWLKTLDLPLCLAFVPNQEKTLLADGD